MAATMAWPCVIADSWLLNFSLFCTKHSRFSLAPSYDLRDILTGRQAKVQALALQLQGVPLSRQSFGEQSHTMCSMMQSWLWPCGRGFERASQAKLLVKAA